MVKTECAAALVRKFEVSMPGVRLADCSIAHHEQRLALYAVKILARQYPSHHHSVLRPIMDSRVPHGRLSGIPRG